jgi:hypothetical protein
LVVSALLGTVQGPQLGPLITTSTVAGSKLLPLIVSLNTPAPTLVGEILLIEGIAVIVNVALLDKGPAAPFLT